MFKIHIHANSHENSSKIDCFIGKNRQKRVWPTFMAVTLQFKNGFIFRCWKSMIWAKFWLDLMIIDLKKIWKYKNKNSCCQFLGGMRNREKKVQMKKKSNFLHITLPINMVPNELERYVLEIVNLLWLLLLKFLYVKIIVYRFFLFI